ncbi:MAG: hypothetical protein K8T25_00555 [Planctomycetia bacterium]|nr:hypothetical protein [Planctomycetia bacterium]
MTFNNVRLTTKLFWGFGTIVLLLIGVTGIYHYAILAALRGYDKLQQTELAIVTHAYNAETSMLQMRRSEQDYLSRLDRTLLQQHEVSLGQLKSETASVEELANQSNHHDTAKAAAEILTYVDEYSRDFKVVVADLDEQGLDQTSGLKGKLKAAEAELANYLKGHDLDDLFQATAELRQREDDFASARTNAAKQALLTGIANFQSTVAKSPCDGAIKQLLNDSLGHYRESADRFVAAGTPTEQQQEFANLNACQKSLDALVLSERIPAAARLLLEIRRQELDNRLQKFANQDGKTNEAATALLQASRASAARREYVSGVETRLAAYTAAYDALVESQRKLDANVKSMQDLVLRIQPAVDGIEEQVAKVAEVKSQQTAAQGMLFGSIALGLSMVAILLSVVLAWMISRSISRPLQNIFKGLKAFSTQELVETGDKIKMIIESMQQGAEQVASAAGQVASASQSLSQGSSEQAAAVEETTSSIEEMACMTKQNAGNATDANNLATIARTSAEKGSQAMTRMSTAISDIQRSSADTSKIVKTIDEIAFQTNLLALNAAVEAARAGEAGRSFAVVAEEVRNLAQRSAEAAKNTAAMIEQSVKSADNGVQISKDVGEVFKEIADGSRKVNELVAQIATACNQQAQGIDQISSTVGQMDTVTQQNAAVSEESASAAEELSVQADELNHVVIQLRAMLNGSEVDKNATDARGVSHVAAKVHQTLRHIGERRDHTAAPKDKSNAAKPSHPTSYPKGHDGASNGNSKTPTAKELIPLEDEEVLRRY